MKISLFKTAYTMNENFPDDMSPDIKKKINEDRTKDMRLESLANIALQMGLGNMRPQDFADQFKYNLVETQQDTQFGIEHRIMYMQEVENEQELWNLWRQFIDGKMSPEMANQILKDWCNELGLNWDKLHTYLVFS